MKFILLISLILISIVYDTSATTYNCWNPTIATPASAATGNTGADTFCKYALTYGSGWLASNWATYAYSTGTSCTESTTLRCKAAHDDTGPAPAQVSDLPTVSSCYTGTTLTALTLTSQAQTPCASTSYFCQATFTGVSGTTATGVSSACTALQCTSATDKLCSMAANTNQVLGCYVGAAYTTGTSTWTKTICAPTGIAVPYASAAFCQNDYSWTPTNGYVITGSCVASCTAQTISLTGTAATGGRTCSSTVYGNTYSGSDASIQLSLITMVLSSIMGLLVIHV